MNSSSGSAGYPPALSPYYYATPGFPSPYHYPPAPPPPAGYQSILAAYQAPLAAASTYYPGYGQPLPAIGCGSIHMQPVPIPAVSPGFGSVAGSPGAHGSGNSPSAPNVRHIGAAFTRQTGVQEQPTLLPQAFTNMTFKDHGEQEWYMDTEATSHLT